MDLDQELEIRCLLSEIGSCPYRVALKVAFGYEISEKCPWQAVLKAALDKEAGEVLK